MSYTNKIKSSQQIRDEFAAAQGPILLRKRFTKEVVVEAPIKKARKGSKLFVFATIAATVVGGVFAVDALMMAYDTVQATICFSCTGDGYNSVYDAVREMNPHASKNEITKLVHEFKSLNGFHDHYDFKDLQVGTYKIPVLK